MAFLGCRRASISGIDLMMKANSGMALLQQVICGQSNRSDYNEANDT